MADNKPVLNRRKPLREWRQGVGQGVEAVVYQDGNYFTDGGQFIPLSQLPGWMKPIHDAGIAPLGMRRELVIAYPCPMPECNKPFEAKASLLAHLQDVHGVVLPDAPEEAEKTSGAEEDDAEGDYADAITVPDPPKRKRGRPRKIKPLPPPEKPKKMTLAAVKAGQKQGADTSATPAVAFEDE